MIAPTFKRVPITSLTGVCKFRPEIVSMLQGESDLQFGRFVSAAVGSLNTANVMPWMVTCGRPLNSILVRGSWSSHGIDRGLNTYRTDTANLVVGPP